MSAYTTKEITRKEAEDMVRRCRMKDRPHDEVSLLSRQELDEELNKYVYEENYTDIVGVLYNYEITP